MPANDDCVNPGTAARKSRLLIVDDDDNLRKLLVATFSGAAYEIHEACDGADALRLAVQLRPDVVLLDVMLPGELDGLEVCRRVKARADMKETCIILLTALGQKRDLERGELAGANAYFVKPFSPFRLLELVDAIMAHSYRTDTGKERENAE
ncbi:MAG: hypothetical protein A2Z95_05930 [Gallionellales bacterium GWA2_60_18]|nr:MAG: hypothetical protein A2Z95_05930 [Gallionellales bacterium GWA2_60_18]